MWEDRWDMEFNPSKCQVVQVTSSKNLINTAYTLHGQILEVVTCAKYLGVDISSGLSWNTHIDRPLLKHGTEWNGTEWKTTKYGTRRKRLEQLYGTVWNENTEQEEKGWNGTEWKKTTKYGTRKRVEQRRKHGTAYK